MDYGNENKIRNFTDLNAWRTGHELVLEIYKITRKFPREELFALTVQLRRAVISITSNSAEGFSRSSYREKAQFYSISLGSLTEVQNQVLISKDLNYITDQEYQAVEEKILSANKFINGLIKKSHSMIRAS